MNVRMVSADGLTFQGLPGFPPPDPPEMTLVALDDRERPIGWAALSATLFGWPVGRGTRFAWLHVDPKAARQAAGTALLETLEKDARSAGVTALSASYMAEDLAAASFADRHGYRRTHQIVDQELCLEGCDQAPWQAAVEAVARGGIRLGSLGQEADLLATERAIWELDEQISTDVPQMVGRNDAL